MASASLPALTDPAATNSDGGEALKYRITIPRHELPLDYLVVKHDPKKYKPEELSTSAQIDQANRDITWAHRREHLFAAAAAGVHVALFAYNLAFWGFEGMPPDRYWPNNPRIRLQMKPRQYGDLEGTKKLWYYYMGRIHGV